MAAEPVTEQGRQTRRRIVAAAAGVVAEKGALDTSLDDVGARAAASRSQLYHYFSDKSDLMLAVAELTCEAVLSGQRAFLEGVDDWAGLERWAAGVVQGQAAGGGRGGCPIANLALQLGERDEDIRTVLAAGFDHWARTIRDVLAAMVSTGELRPNTDVDGLATSTLASLEGGLILAQASRDPDQLRRALDGALSLISSHRTTG